MKKIYVSVTNDLATDQRIHRVCTSLQNWGYQVVLVGRILPESTLITRNYSFRRMKLIFDKKVMFYAEFNIRLFLLLLFSKADILLANDLDTLPANYLAARLKRIRLVLDVHEYFPETPEVYNRRVIKGFWSFVERKLVPRIDRGYTVSGSIARVYKEKYNVDLQVVRNVPFKLLPSQVKVSPVNAPYILYQGSLNMGRGIELVIQAMSFLLGVHFFIAGTGPLVLSLRTLVSDLSLSHKVIFLGRLKPEQLCDVTVNASAGISLEEPVGLSYQYALPNKLFDYIQARVPVLVSDLPEMRAIVRKYNVGLVAMDRSASNVSKLLSILVFDRELRRLWNANLDNAAKELCWENECSVLQPVFS